MKISLLLPTRNRIPNLIRLNESLVNTNTKTHEIEYCFRLDWDDKESFEYIKSILYPHKVCIGSKPINNTELWNDCYGISTGELIMMVGDDFVFRTVDWANKVISIFEQSKDKILLVFGEDGIQHGSIPTHAIIHRKWVETVGYYCYSKMGNYYHDTWFGDVSELIGRKVYVPNLYFEHMHFSVNKSEYDENYNRAQENIQKESELYHGIFNQERLSNAIKLKSVMINE